MFFSTIVLRKSKQDTFWRCHFWVPCLPLEPIASTILTSCPFITNLRSVKYNYPTPLSAPFPFPTWVAVCIMTKAIDLCFSLSTSHRPIMIEEEDWDRESKGRVVLLNRMNFRKGSKRQLTPAPQNGPYLWNSCACISYYPAIISPRIYGTIIMS